MSVSYIPSITTGSLENIDDPFTLISPLEGKSSIGIDQVHALLKELAIQAGNQKRTIVFHPADRLTLAAQQALLKTCEEPPGNTQIILLTLRPDALLPTLHSRCTLTSFVKNETIGESSPRSLPPSQSIAACLTAIDSLGKDKDEMKENAEHILNGLRNKNSASLPSPQDLLIQKGLITLIDDLEHNVNTRLALDHFALTSLLEKK